MLFRVRKGSWCPATGILAPCSVDLERSRGVTDRRVTHAKALRRLSIVEEAQGTVNTGTTVGSGHTKMLHGLGREKGVF